MATVKRRKTRIVVPHEAIVAYCVLHPKADTGQVARYFGIHRRTAQKHMKTVPRYLEE